MRRVRQRAIALEAVRTLLPLMGLQPELVGASDAVCVFDELHSSQPQSVASQWWESADTRQIGLFVGEWEAWRKRELAKCAFCQGRKENPDGVFCTACSDLLEGAV